MTRAADLTPDADADVAAAVRWYESLQSGRGADFLVELNQHLGHVAGAAEGYPLVRPGVRAAPIPRSRFIAYYRVEPARILVTAILHESADPKRWLRRT